MAYGLMTYDDAARREDLIDVLGDVTPDETPLFTLLGKTKASGTYHEWVEDYIDPPTSVTHSSEGAAASYSDLTQPARRGNVTAIISETFRVSGTERAVSVAAMGDPLSYQKAKALKTWKMKAEFQILRGAVASGSSGVARQMAGIQNIVTTVATARSSGTSLSETEFNDICQDSWTESGTNSFDIVAVPGGLRRKISSFTAGATKNVDSSDKRLTRPVEIYESDFGIKKILPAHRYVTNTAGSVHFLGLREVTFKVAWLRPVFTEMLAKDGDRENGQIIGEWTLEYRAQRASAKRSGYSQTG